MVRLFRDDQAGGWFCLTVRARSERSAARVLEVEGVRAFYPVTHYRRRIARGRRRWVIAERMYLPRYVFALFPGSPVAHEVLACPLITGAVTGSDGVSWARLDPTGLQRLFRMRSIAEEQEFAARRAQAAARAAARLRIGDQAQFIAGPLQGKTGRVVTIQAGNVRLDLPVLGTVEASAADLRRGS